MKRSKAAACRSAGPYGRAWRDVDPVGYRATEGWNKPDPKAKKYEGWVYFIRAVGAVKIGYSLDPEKRLQAIQCNVPGKAELLGKIDGSKYTERVLHHHLRAYRISGEWFSLDVIPELMRLLRREYGE